MSWENKKNSGLILWAEFVPPIHEREKKR